MRSLKSRSSTRQEDRAHKNSFGFGRELRARRHHAQLDLAGVTIELKAEKKATHRDEGEQTRKLGSLKKALSD